MATSPRTRLSTGSLPAPREDRAQSGYIDFYGFHLGAGGWFICGWMAGSAFTTGQERLHGALVFETSRVEIEGTIAFFNRDDVSGLGLGFVLFAPSSGRHLGRLQAFDLSNDGTLHRISVSDGAPQLRDADLTARLRPICQNAAHGTARAELLGLISRRGFAGQSTLETLTDKIFLEIDEIIACPTKGVVLMGWRLADSDVLVSIRLRSGVTISEVDLKKSIGVSRHDVIEAVGAANGFTDHKCGFIVYVDDVISGDGDLYLEVETARREVAYKTLPAPKMRGMAAIRRILESSDISYAGVRDALRHVLNPAVTGLWKEYLKIKPEVTVEAYGRPPQAPRTTVIVPLYGRIDYMEYQLALTALHGGWKDIEFIYVLDDPPKKQELLRLAESSYARFNVPFKLLLLSKNVGFAPANNVGLAHATGEYICFLNSDVFAETGDWIDRLIARLQNDDRLGAVGPLLLFEDGSVQHEGIEFAPIRVFENLPFPLHTRKGMRPNRRSGIQAERYITGACMVMSRTLALSLGGFDESYIIGDFEDTDLCLKIQERGKTCAVDHSVTLFHLERKSQQGPGALWRMNLTLVNAWTHYTRWSKWLEGHAPT